MPPAFRGYDADDLDGFQAGEKRAGTSNFDEVKIKRGSDSPWETYTSGGLTDVPWHRSQPTKDMRAELEGKGLETMNDGELISMSELFNDLNDSIAAGASVRTWLTLYKKMDDNDSGAITFDEFYDTMYNELKFYTKVGDVPTLLLLKYLLQDLL